MRLTFDVISCILLPIGGYLCMKEMQRRANKAISTMTFAEGLYRFNPLHGDKAVRAAQGYARAGTFLFIFSFILPFFIWLITITHQ